MASTEVKSESNSDIKVIIAPVSSIENITEKQNVKFLQLRHPRTGLGSCFLYNSSNNSLNEVMTFDEQHRSWFIGSRVVADGKMYLVTPVNPVFLLLPYMLKAEKLVPLDQMLEDDEFKQTEEILLATCQEARLQLVADSKGSKDLNVWKYSQEKTLTWLEAKVKSLSAVFEKTSVDTTGGAASSIYKSSSADEHEYLRYALGVVQEYLSESLGQELERRLSIPKLETKSGTKRLSNVDLEEEENKPSRKKAKTEEGPLEDYSKGTKKTVVKEEASAKEKALAQSAKGSKSITSFFKKK